MWIPLNYSQLQFLEKIKKGGYKNTTETAVFLWNKVKNKKKSVILHFCSRLDSLLQAPLFLIWDLLDVRIKIGTPNYAKPHRQDKICRCSTSLCRFPPITVKVFCPKYQQGSIIGKMLSAEFVNSQHWIILKPKV